MKNSPLFFILFVLGGVLSSCTNDSNTSNNKTVSKTDDNIKRDKKMEVPTFNKDSAFAFVETQVNFGPRIPGTQEHLACAEWIESKFKSYNLDVSIQKGIATTYDNKRFDILNIISSFNPDVPDRILLCAHWDTRPFADRDEGDNKDQKFDGANDGGSGVGVLLEIARQISIAKPNIGIDIILFDLEDYGKSDIDNSWCLGSQYWAKNLHKPGYYARYGILLDMVGAAGATFPKEGTSRRFASGVVDKIWSTAKKLGYSDLFVDRNSSPTTDDHLYVNRDAYIPCIAIVHYDVIKGDYFPHHHRVTDNMDNIDKETLGAVGQLLLQVIFEESASL